MINKISVREYICKNIIFLFMSFVWYKRVMLRCLDGMGYFQSKRIFVVVLLSMFVLGVITNKRKNRNWGSIFSNIALPFGVYTLLSYVEVKKKVFVIPLLCAAILSLLLIIVIHGRPVKNRRKRRMIVANRLRKTASGVQFFLALALFFSMTIIGFGDLFGTSIMQPNVVATTYEDSYKETIRSNFDKVCLLQEHLWEKLSVQEKLDVMQCCANIERYYLGIPHELKVGTDFTGEYVLGYYDEGKNEIIISADSLLNDTPSEVLNTLCHESYHSYQQCIVEVMENASEDMKSLRMFESAHSYATEFEDYKSWGDEYYDQECETDARNYAEEAVEDYYRSIEKILAEKEMQLQ